MEKTRVCCRPASRHWLLPNRKRRLSTQEEKRHAPEMNGTFGSSPEQAIPHSLRPFESSGQTGHYCARAEKQARHLPPKGHSTTFCLTFCLTELGCSPTLPSVARPFYCN